MKLAVAVLSGLVGMVCGGPVGMLASALAALPLRLWLWQGMVIAVMLAAMSVQYAGFSGLAELGCWDSRP